MYSYYYSETINYIYQKLFRVKKDLLLFFIITNIFVFWLLYYLEFNILIFSLTISNLFILIAFTHLPHFTKLKNIPCSKYIFLNRKLREEIFREHSKDYNIKENSKSIFNEFDKGIYNLSNIKSYNTNVFSLHFFSELSRKVTNPKIKPIFLNIGVNSKLFKKSMVAFTNDYELIATGNVSKFISNHFLDNKPNLSEVEVEKVQFKDDKKAKTFVATLYFLHEEKVFSTNKTNFIERLAKLINHKGLSKNNLRDLIKSYDYSSEEFTKIKKYFKEVLVS